MSAFTDAVARHTSKAIAFSVGACPGCKDCGLPEEATEQEILCRDADSSWFSWHPCESCGSSLGGDRHPAHSLSDPPGTENNRILHWSICSDCLFYHANGDEPTDGEWSEDDDD